jgi:HlyD family secretion protein/epimerase transport system membrane fusion protein
MDALIEDAVAWSVQLVLLPTRPQAIAVLALTLVLAFALILKVRARRRRRRLADLRESDSLPLRRVVRGPKIVGYAALLLFFGGFGAWAAVAPLTSAAIAPGVVSPDGSRKTVQHLEGGIVRAIHVAEGDHVEAGQLLVTLEDIQARADFEEQLELFVHLATVEARLLAEQAGAATVEPPAALEGLDAAVVAPSLAAQRRLFESRRATLDGREQILGQRIRQLEAEITGLHEVIAARNEQLALIEQEVAGVQILYDQGLSNLPRLLELKRAQADLRADRATSEAAIARHEQSIGETRLQLLTMREQHREEVDEALSQARTELAAACSRLPSREDVLARTEVVAPVAGTVMNVHVTTATGVVQPGEPLLDVVPEAVGLVIDARVRPTDMDVVRAGQTARVLFPAYAQRNLPQMFGRLRSISADRLIDERTGEAFFLARIEIAPDEAGLAPGIELLPGMPADVMILTGERTLLDYLVGPFIDSLTKSFRES